MQKTALTVAAIAASLLSSASSAAAGTALYVSNFNSNTVTAYDATTGASLGTIVTGGKELNGANGITFSPGGLIYLSSQNTNRVNVYDPSTGKLVRILDPLNKGNLSQPQGVKFGPDGALYVASYANDRIVRYASTTGTSLDVSTFANVTVAGVSAVGPIDPDFAPNGNILVGTFGAHQVLEYGGPLSTTPGQLVLAFQPSTSSVSYASAANQGTLHGAATFRVLVDAIDSASFTGWVEQFNEAGQRVGTFIPNGSGGLVLTGGIALGPDGNLYVANVKVDQNFTDIGSQILKFDGKTGAFLGVLVDAGKGLNVPFAMVFHTTP